MSTPPRRAIMNGGTMEYGQTFIINRMQSAHNLQEMEQQRRNRNATASSHQSPLHAPTTTGSSSGINKSSSWTLSLSSLNNNSNHTATSSSGSPRPKGPAQNYSERDPLVQVEEGNEQDLQVEDIQHHVQLPKEQAQKVYKFMVKKGSSVESLEVDSNGMMDGYGFYNSFSSRPSSPKTVPCSQTIRFQVLVWNVGALDVVQGRVPVTFRVTVFWNDTTVFRGQAPDDFDAQPDSNDSVSTATIRRNRSWEMRGRQKAVPVREKDDFSAGMELDVPAVSILNVVTFDTIGSAEISLLRQDTGLWQWTCMYRATLMQDHWMVDDFPHDEHDICLKLAVLAHRKPDARWDRSVWSLGLATEKDSMGCVRVPHGMVVGDLCVPEFSRDNELKFNFETLDIGPGGTHFDERCLSVKLRVRRNSYYYDRNIVPLLGLLNFVAITITALGADKFFERGLLTLNITFVEISIRMATDKHLPSVPYQIKLQRVLNEYFFGLLFLVLESNLVFELHRFGRVEWTGPIDLLAAAVVLTHNIWTLFDYYIVSRRRSAMADNK